MQEPAAAAVAEALARAYSRMDLAEPSRSRVWEAISEYWSAFLLWLRSLLDWPQLAMAASPLVYGAVVLLLASIAIVAAIHLGRRLERRLRRSAAAAADAVGQAGGPRDAAGWEAAARRALEQGRWRDAAFALYQSAVHRLDERGAVRFETSKTPGDYRREAHRYPELGRPFDNFIRLFLPVAFGAQAPDASALDTLRIVARELGVHA